MKFAYADPPYIGQAKKHYGNEASYGGEVDQKALIERLCLEYPDGWALSSSSSALKEILSYCPDDVRVMAWVKPFASFKPGVNPAYAWEPVIVRGGRRRGRELPTIRDWVSANITLKKGLCGVKPLTFCKWIFEVLGMMSGDELSDLFPGSGAVSTAWNEYKKQVELTEEAKG
jgi:hypothetical protein